MYIHAAVYAVHRKRPNTSGSTSQEKPASPEYVIGQSKRNHQESDSNQERASKEGKGRALQA